MMNDAFQRRFLLLLVAVISIFFLWMIKDFIVPLLLAAIFTSLIYPLYLRLLSWFRGKAGAASGVTLLIFILVIILPVVGFVGLVASEAVKVTEDVAPWAQEHLSNREDINQNLRRLPGYRYIAPYSQQIVSKIGSTVAGLGNFILKRASAITAGTLILFLNFAIMLYAMFFFLIHGKRLLDKILYYMPLHHQDEKKLLNGFRAMAHATIKSLVIIGAMQGTLAGLALWAAGVPSALFWGTVMSVLSMIPNIGSALVWVPACIFLFIQGKTTAAVAVFLWCALIVGSADNVLRPILVGKDTEVPELLVLVSTLGGLSMFGLVGFILGPVVALMFLMIWEIYGTAFKDSLPKVGNL